MNFFKQIPAEAKKMLRSKFILISFIGIFLLIVAGAPILSYIATNLLTSNNYYYYGNEDPVIIDGVEYDGDSDMIWEYRNLLDSQEYMEGMEYENDAAEDYINDLTQLMMEFYEDYIPFATTDYSENIYDYREGFAYQMRGNISDLYFLQQGELDESALNETSMHIYYFDPASVLAFNDLTDAERNEKIAALEQDLADFDLLMRENDFSKYVEMQLRSYEEEIQANLDRIETLEQDLIDNPEQEEMVSDEIEGLLQSNQRLEENSIPMLLYRQENNIVIDDGSWQDKAIQSMERSQDNIFWSQNEIDSANEEDFYEDQWMADRYGTFTAYIESLEKEISDAQVELLVAQSSIENDKPDMEYVPEGARSVVYNNFSSMILVMVFAVLLGGWVIATEFSSGTVRLLMIRPRTRLKVLYSKYLAGLKLIIIMYFVIFLVTIIVSGITSGFADYGYPNYTASGEQNFFVMLIVHILASATVIGFVYSLSFAMSVVTKNIAVSIIIPVLIMFGGFLLMAWLAQRPSIDILAFTPLAYITIYDLFSPNGYSLSNELIDKGMPLSIGLGVTVMLVYSAVLMGIATVVFNKKDITN